MKVLIVEDNRDHQFIIRKKLEEYRDDIGIDTAETVDEAERLIEKNSYDSILLDYRLQGSSGIELVKWIQREDIEVPVIMITNMEDVSIAVQAVKLGVYDYLCKNRESFDRLPLLIDKATEEFRLKKKLKEAEFRYSTLVEGINEAVFLMSRDREILYISSSVERLFGCTEEECKKNFRDLFSERGWLTFRSKCTEVLKDRIVEPFVLMMRKTDGHTLMAEINASALKEHNHVNAIIGTIQDVTKRVLLERELNAEREETRKANKKLRIAIEDLRRAQAQLVQSEKLAAVGELVSGVAHELNNPLFSAMGNTELLIMDCGNNEDEREKLEKILDSINRARLVVRELVQFSQGENIEKEQLYVNNLIERSVKRMEYELKLRHVDVEMDLQEDIPAFYGNPVSLQRVLLNILTNARQAFDEKHSGGLIRIISSYDQENREVVIKAANNGPQIPESIVSKIFDPFFTTREVGDGTGLGLSTAYGIIKEHEGDLTVESDPEWTVFTIQLPVKDDALVSLRPLQRDSDSEPSPLNGQSILIVESEQVIRNLLHDFFAKRGCNVKTASTGKEAIEIMEKGNIDSLVIDDHMSDTTGASLIELIEEKNLDIRGVKLLIVENGQGKEQGFDDTDGQRIVLKKPFSLDELLKALSHTP
jgi:PAS domain S-box-containing protein